MTLHRNAKTTPHMRALLVSRVRVLHWSTMAAASAAGISRRTAFKGLARHRMGGRAALEDRSSTPYHQPRRTPADVTARIVAARYERCTAWVIATRLQIPRSTVAVVLARAGLNRLTRLSPPPTIQRYEWPVVGDLVHLDVKPLARILRVGPRIHGNRGAIVKGAGYEFAHVAIDDRSRVAYVEVLPDQRGGTSAGFLRRMVGWFARRGVVVTRVLTDNAPGYLSDVFAATATQRRVRLVRARPHHPQTNGKAERFIQTLMREWAYAVPYASSWRRTTALRPWVRHYNTARPHTALGYQPPCARFPRAAQ